MSVATTTLRNHESIFADRSTRSTLGDCAVTAVESRRHHPSKEVSDAMEYAVDLGWTIVKGRNHTYAMLRCPKGDRSGCQVPVFHTPKNPGNHARDLIHDIDSCTCESKGDDE